MTGSWLLLDGDGDDDDDDDPLSVSLFLVDDRPLFLPRRAADAANRAARFSLTVFGRSLLLSSSALVVIYIWHRSVSSYIEPIVSI